MLECLHTGTNKHLASFHLYNKLDFINFNRGFLFEGNKIEEVKFTFLDIPVCESI